VAGGGGGDLEDIGDASLAEEDVHTIPFERVTC